MQKNLYKKLPESAGVYLMKNQDGQILYIGKAGNLRRRVSSYFERPHDYKVEKLVGEVKKIDYKKTDTAIEALILESRLIKKFEPIFNVKEKDDKSFLWVHITKDEFPRVLLTRGEILQKQSYEAKPRKIVFGPFTSAVSIREALRILRRIFPWSTHPPLQNFKPRIIESHSHILQNMRMRKKGTDSRHSHSFAGSHYAAQRPCFDYEIGLCPGTCVGAISRADYLKNIRNLKLFFEGKKKKIIQLLKKEMDAASKKLEFEKAEKLKKQIFALQHIQDIALISDSESLATSYLLQDTLRIEGYDISNISGTAAVGAMAVFSAKGGPASGWINGRPDKNEYRKFRIRTITQSDDIGMLKEVLRRRFRNNWPLPNLILVDGGVGQVNAAKSVLDETGLKLPVVGIAKGAKRKNNKFIGRVPAGIDKNVLIRLRNEAHRFAIGYHKRLRGIKFIHAP